MLKRYKNEFFQAIQSAGLDVSDFSGEEAPLGELDEFSIRYKPGKIFFLARQRMDGTNKFDFKYSRYIGKDPAPESDLSAGWCRFEVVMSTFERWLHNEVKTAIEDALNEVKTAIEDALIPDLWSQATSSSSFIGSHTIDSQGASKFTEEERRQIKLAVSNFRLLVEETFAPNVSQLSVVAEQLEYLASAVDRLNRFDWKAVAIATIMTILVALSLDTERGRQLYGLFQQAFSAISHLLR